MIKESGNVIFTQPLFQNTSNPSLSNASVFFTFPKRDVYEILIVGKPNSSGGFQPFTLQYDVRVDQIAENTGTENKSALQIFLTTHALQIVGGIFVVTFCSWFLLKNKKKDKISQ